MKAYLIKRLLQLIFLLAAVATIVFFLVHFIPGDPAAFILGEFASTEDINRLHHQLNLDKPLAYQYIKFIKNLSDGSLGESLYDGHSVSQSILAVLPYTIYLSLAAMSLALLVSFPLGIWAAWRENTFSDAAVTLFSAIGLAIPNFFLGPLLIVLFSVKLKWLPVSGTEGLKSIVLPALTLATSMCALLTRIIKTSLATEQKKPYVLLAQAKGLSSYEILRHFLLKNAMIPIVTTVGLQLGALLTGTVITETVFSRPGIGSLLMTAIHRRDYPMVQGIVVFITFVYLLFSFLVDMSYFFLDPRIGYEIKNKHYKQTNV